MENETPVTNEDKGVERVPPCGCGGDADFKFSRGGFTIYVVIECKRCGHSSRRRGLMRGLVPLGFGVSENAPQNSREEALEAWNETRSTTSTLPAKGDKN